MATKRKIENIANDVDLTGAFLKKTEKDKTVNNIENTGTTTPDGSWVRATFICSKELVDKIKFIAEEENFSIREVVEKSFSNTISRYEAKKGKKIVIKSKKRKDIDSIF